MEELKKNQLEVWAEEVARQDGFKIDKLLYQGVFYTADKIRNLVYSGEYEGKTAVLKVYDDPRLSDEPRSHQAFLDNNASKILTAPALYRSQQISPKKGWLIMERLPSVGEFFKSPLNSDDRKEFLEVYFEYRKHFPAKPSRELLLREQLPSDRLHVFRIAAWFRLAQDCEALRIMAEKDPILKSGEFIPHYLSALAFIEKVFKDVPMQWSHGHFKPQEIYKTPGKYYLTDFAHCTMYPVGYELGFMVWADFLMRADYDKDYDSWKHGLESWIDDLNSTAEKLGIKNHELIIRGSIVERIIGTILADITASDKSDEEKLHKITYLYRLLSELIY